MTAAQYLFSFNGRINRAKWWLLILIQMGASIVFYVGVSLLVGTALLSTISSGSLGEAAGNASGGIILTVLLSLAYGIGMFVVWLAVTVKRLHDRDKNGAWIVLFALGPWCGYMLAIAFALNHAGPLSSLCALAGFGISIWAFVELGCLRGTIGENRFGSDPLAPLYVYASPQPAPQYGAPTPTPGPVAHTVKAESVAARKLELAGSGDFSEYYLSVTSAELIDMPDGLVIGRESRSAIFAIIDDRISRVHATLFFAGGDFSIADAGSSNGTELNGRRLPAHERRVLHSGDRLKFGPAVFVVTVE